MNSADRQCAVERKERPAAGHPDTAVRFLVIGAMKSGTTSLHSVLAAHPDIRLISEKERPTLTTGTTERERQRWHARLGDRAIGEVSAAYMQRPHVAINHANVSQHLGMDGRVIAILRHPVSRAVSQWRHLTDLGTESRPISVALTDPPSEENPYLAYSSYWWQLKPWIGALGRQRVLVVRLEDFANDTSRIIHQIEEFLNVSHVSAVFPRANQAERRTALRGVIGDLGRSRIYRKLLRPLVPSGLRQAVVKDLARRQKRAPTQVLSSDDQQRFLALLQWDLMQLADTFPNAVWPGTDLR